MSNRKGIALAVLALLGVAGLASPSRAQEPVAPQPAEIVPQRWLVIAPLDERGRRPFRPDAVFAAHLLAPDAAPPVVGAKLTGEKGKEQAWTEREAKDGALDGEIGYAYTAIEAPEATVMLAQLAGAAQLFVNGAGFVGDAYGYGFGGVPVALRKGRNDVYVCGVRGGVRLKLVAPGARVVVGAWDVTKPDLPVGEPARSADWLACLVLNATDAPTRALRVRTSAPGGFFAANEQDAAPMPALSLRKQWIPVRRAKSAPAELAAEKPGSQALAVALAEEGAPEVRAEIGIELKDPHAARRYTFSSLIEGSVQTFAALAPAKTDGESGLVLSLHGAGVDALGQAQSYSRKDDFWIVAPTNRRPFGFDWQDWGRADAYEVLALGLGLSGGDPGRVFLTGHSMGGHGTWNIAASDPGRFLAIAPSAGWASFDTYGSRPDGALAALWRAADAGSRTEDLVANLALVPTYILHGTADDNVPCDEARAMEKRLRDAGAEPLVHYQEGAGHWWDGDAAPGADCVDWPAIFELFRAQGARDLPARFDVTCAEAALAREFHGLVLEQPLEYGKPMRMAGTFDAQTGELALVTQNVRRLLARRPAGESLVLDGERFAGAPRAPGARPGFLRANGHWTASDAAPASEKSAGSTGPFKRAFDRHFALVYGTSGDERESRELFERARYDQQAWWYRANGTPVLVSDRRFLEQEAKLDHRVRNVILYGNADTNAAWSACVPASSPVAARRGELKLGERAWKGAGLAALFVQPRADGDPGREGAPPLVACFADTGPAGSRLGYTFATFISGAGYPDYALISSDVLAQGDGGVLAAGWFDCDWKLQPGGYAQAPAPAGNAR